MERNDFSTNSDFRKQKAVAYWLLAGVIMIAVQVLLGGITRLTGSGLSITEWKPIIGAVPPLNEHDWQVAFEKYQQIAQFRYLNAHFTLEDFKHIFFWEWLHREWARIGLAAVFSIGFIFFLVKGYFSRKMIAPLAVLFLLGGLQGAIGWIMVKSGLNDTDLYVNHIKLAVHFLTALMLMCYTLWFALKLLVPDDYRTFQPRLLNATILLLFLLVVQLGYGAFMAGLKAAAAAATWPTINGQWGPRDVHQYGTRSYSGLNAWASHPIAVHFVHRSLAYLLFFGVLAWTWAAGRQGVSPALRRWRWWPALLVIVQLLLGIFTVVNGDRTATAGHFGTFEYLAEAHQLVAMGLLAALVSNLYLLKPKVAA